MSGRDQVIEFAVGGERYCIGIEFVSEVVRVDEAEITAIPDAPAHVEGVVDLRGETTEVIDPYAVLNLPGELDGFEQMLVFDEPTGLLVDDVYRVLTVERDAIEEEPTRSDDIKGVVNRDDGFLLWTSPDRLAP